MTNIKSDIPVDAIEIAISIDEEGQIADHRTVNCFVDSILVGQRVYNTAGILVLETPLKNDLKHGCEVTWDDFGKMIFTEPYINGKMHGTAKQYGRNGQVIGTYEMIHGTGFDIWREETTDNKISIAEIHSLKDGLPHGYEWWFASSKQDLCHERHWQVGKLHGVERRWNNQGRLKRGYPKFFILDQIVTKQKYIKMAFIDPSLPIFQEADNLPYRVFPADVMTFMSSQYRI